MISLRKYPYFVLAAFLMSFLFYHQAFADTLGQKVNFFVNSEFDVYKRTSLSATLRHISEKAYFYVDDSYWNSLSFLAQNIFTNNINNLAEEFDNNIYPKEVLLWGSEPNPGIDGNPRVTILLEELSENSGGYFEGSNGYSRTQFPNSNEREMLFINSGVLISSPEIVNNFLAHEFQHLISLNQKELLQEVREDPWLNEIRSEYSITRIGDNDTYVRSNISRRAYSFFQSPSDSLTEWPNNPIDYGIAALFGEYLVDQFGVGILSETLRKPLAGINSLNEYLRLKSYYERFEDVFLNWMGASYLNIFFQDSRLGYKRPELQSQRVQPQQRIFLSSSLAEYSVTHNIKDWQPVWIEADVSPFSGDSRRSVKLELSGDYSQIFVAGYVAFNNGVPSQLRKIKMSNGKGIAYVLNTSGGLNKIALFVTKGTKVSGFGISEYASPLSIKVSVIATEGAVSSVIKDGDLIRKRGEKEIYVIWGKYKRYLNPGVISLYGHLNSANTTELEPLVFDSYQTSNYVKYINNERVYAVWPDSTKHWLHINPQQWDASSRDWGAIFTINDLELNYYKTSIDITR